MDDVDKIELKLLSRPLGPDGGERHRVVGADQDVVQLRPDRAPGQFGELAKYPHHLGDAFVVAGQRAGAGDKPDDVLGKIVILQSAEVAPAERRAGRPHQILVRLRHLDSSGSMWRTNLHPSPPQPSSATPTGRPRP